ncbi:uncharacterized protein CC84DRAFT_1163174 [Paraphaeosphaeria sporulosa]|uniref:Zn(2)-C6 fungal-type domain-containing protein n=1 Tax=Paraphaeosphaeria sporulosa TaxID=1460663 RepID=A0A177CH31_9PLEO|nr:uncharacterized protein CC84DRAFT_1163174 [Paraphaeosphaeria sporulosa]OAG06875.1 hypothetical protein CC84DRAFT_1163174 [Paraphaeosphaeria sporulosa]
MSLFGGDESTTSAHSLSPSERSSSPQNAQDAPFLPFTVPDPDDSLDEDFQPSSPEPETTPLEAAPREERAVKPQSWRRYTEADRAIAESLENIESTDLAAHLYNAHNLKRRLRLPEEQLEKIKDWQSKDAWLKKGEELQFRDPLTGDLETELVPSRLWTAWPLPPKRLPPKGSATHRTENSEDGWYISSATDRGSGEVMREELLALFLRTAKDNWAKRQTVDEERGLHADTIAISSAPPSSSDSEAEAQPEIHSSSTKKKKAKGASSKLYSSETDGEQVTRQLDGSDVDTEDDLAQGMSIDSELESALPNRTRQRGLSNSQQSATEAAFLADDDEARRILEPSINSLLSRIDKLALAVHRNRLNHAGDGLHRSGSGSDYTTDAETPAPRARSLSRSQSHSRGPKRTNSKKQALRPQKPTQNLHNAADSDSASEYGADLESEDEGAPDYLKTTCARSGSGNSSPRSNASSNAEVRKGAGVMDWSELLGLAAIAGFDKRVVESTAQRCASLFGEQMSFRTFSDGRASLPPLEPVQYIPSKIPAPDEAQVVPGDAVREPGSSGQIRTLFAKRPYFDPGSLRCPHTDCPGNLKDFSGSSRLTEHVRRKHGYDPRTNDSDNEERTVGGVHIDGYLQPIWAKAGWLGHGRAKSEATETETEMPRRKRSRMDSRPNSTVTSAYTTQDEQEVEEHTVPGQIADPAVNPARRPKQKKTCTNCSRRKKLCDGNRPCERCRNLGEGETCEYRVTSARVACLNCRRRKQRCDYSQPCARCERSGQDENCQYPT